MCIPFRKGLECVPCFNRIGMESAGDADYIANLLEDVENNPDEQKSIQHQKTLDWGESNSLHYTY